MVTATAITRKIPKTICWAKTETAAAAAPKGRPRDAEQTRKRILEAATVEFARKGLGGARVDAIALQSKSNKRMIYHYFGSKEQLFKHVIETAYVGIRAVSGQFMQMVKQILDRGVATGVFRKGIDPVQLNITIAAIGYYYLTIRFTGSIVFERDLMSPDNQNARLQFNLDTMLRLVNKQP